MVEIIPARCHIPEESRNERGGGSMGGPYHQGVPIVTAWIIHVAYKLKKACQTLESHNMARISFRALDSHSHMWRRKKGVVLKLMAEKKMRNTSIITAQLGMPTDMTGRKGRMLFNANKKLTPCIPP